MTKKITYQNNFYNKKKKIDFSNLEINNEKNNIEN